jgi:hypothetical protein
VAGVGSFSDDNSMNGIFVFIFIRMRRRGEEMIPGRDY